MTQEIEQDNIPENIDVLELLQKEFDNLSPKTLEIYKYVQKNNPKVLFRTDMDLKPETVDGFALSHQEMYEGLSDEIVIKIINGESDITVIGSAMFGGKTTLAMYISEKLKQRGFENQIYIADMMNEDTVTGRSYPGEDKIRPAMRYGSSTEKINLPKSEKSIVILDEFSFLPNLEDVERFVKECRENGTKVILLGLNTNYLGDNLEVFQKLQETVGDHNLVTLKSFVPGVDLNNEPTGTKTTRFLKVGGYWIKDFGVLPLVVSKELGKLIHYCSATEEQASINILRDRPNLLDYILNPSAKLELIQRLRLDQLKEKFGYIEN